MAAEYMLIAPLPDLLSYLGGLDWLGGLLVATAATAVATGGFLTLRHARWQPGERITTMMAALAHRLPGGRGTDPDPRWLCSACHSWNPPGSVHCYRGCGSRADVESEVPDPGEVEAAGPQRGGRGGRRG